MKWRIIMTDTESPTGVAPECDKRVDPNSAHWHYEPGEAVWCDHQGVYDCCPHPHIETYGDADARTLVDALNGVAGGEGAEICS
jgi:hypothetical protein